MARKRQIEAIDLTVSDDEFEGLRGAQPAKRARPFSNHDDIENLPGQQSFRISSNKASAHASSKSAYHYSASTAPASSYSSSSPSGQPYSSSTKDGWSASSQIPRSSQTVFSSQAKASQHGVDTRIDLTQDNEEDAAYETYQLYGVLNTKIVGVQYYRGRANINERVLVIREPGNAYDSNAIQVNNVVGTQIGHIPRTMASKLAPFMDSQALLVEGTLTGRVGQFDCPIALSMYGTSDRVASADLKKQMQAAKLPVSDLIQAEKQRKKEEAEQSKRRKAATKAGAAMRNASGLQYDTSSGQYANLNTPSLGQGDMSMEEVLANSQSFNPREVGEIVDKFGADEEALSKLPSAEQPKVLRTKLLPYQLQGLQWMLDHESPKLPTSTSNDVKQLWKRDPKGFYTNIATTFSTNDTPALASGGILADDMGLGKTLQVISLIVSAMDRPNGCGPTLIVSPLSVMSNWTAQIASHIQEKHALKVFVYHTASKSVSSPKELSDFDVVVTTYNTMALENNPNSEKSVTGFRDKGLYSVRWRRVVLDEGHTIRNPKAKMSQAAYALQGASRWILSGTPIVNKLKDLYSLVKFLQLTGGLEHFDIFNGTLIRPLKNGNAEARVLLQGLVSSICLRRMKSMSFIDLRLPKLSCHKYPIKFLPTEKKKYQAFKAEAEGLLLKVQEKRAQKGMSTYSHLLEVLLRMRQTCNHWKLCGDRVTKLLSFLEENKIVDTTIEANRRALQAVLQLRIESQEDCAVCLDTLKDAVITHCGHAYCRRCIEPVIHGQAKCPLCRAELSDPAKCLIEPAANMGEGDGDGDLKDADMDEDSSSKIEALIKILKASSKHGGKTIIFSQWTSFLDIVERQLVKHNFVFTRLDGKMSVSRRDEAIASLDHNPECTIMLASLAVCGVGLNLVSANQVILTDSWWAPSAEDQAIDRVHRLGQTRPTTVFRLVMEDSVEDQVLEIQKKKRELTAMAFREPGSGHRGQEREGRLRDIETLLRH